MRRSYDAVAERHAAEIGDELRREAAMSSPPPGSIMILRAAAANGPRATGRSRPA
ncbi:hypothetical protein [Micromonospora sp. AMSO31t]|uniref:hypothetical protein n=1 Tax=Micromonospora sp. AMSO31t TaxID=2650566 RepID=UPI001788CDF3|nr:hypothetical protein [Micromonospora sp. AMSO31t]